MSEARPTQIKLQPEDAQRLRRLAEEVQGRLEEMALIAARGVGRKLERDAIRKFVPSDRAKGDRVGDERSAVAAAAVDPDALYIEISTHPDGTHTCAIFCPPPASEVFVENPCGSGPIPCA